MKRFLALLLTVAMMLSMVTFASAEEKTTITAWVSSGAEDGVYTQMFEDFNAKTADIVVDFQFFPQDELLNKLRTSETVGDTPDIVVIDGMRVAYFYEMGMVADLGGYISDELKADLLPSVVAECTYGDGVMGSVAQFDSGLALWADKAALEAVGARIPTSYKDAWTKEEFEKILTDLKANYEYPLFIRQSSPQSLYFTFLPVIRSFGGDFLNRDTLLATGTMDSEGTIAAYSYVAELVEKGIINPTCDYEDAFYGRKEAAMALIGHWMYTQHTTAFGDNAILVPIPDFGGGVFTSSGSTVDFMTTAAVNRGVGDKAWKVLEAMLSPEYIEMVVNVNGALPARASVMDALPNYQEGGRLYLFREQLEAGISYLRPNTPAHSTVYNAMRDVMVNVLAGADPAEELKAAAEYVDEIIMENGWNK